MGLWGGVGRTQYGAIQELMQDSLKLWFNAHIIIFSPDALDGEVEAYNPYEDNDVRREPLVVFDSGANGAVILPSGGMNSVDTGGQLGTIGGMQFQTVREEMTPLPAGLRVRVVSSPNDPGLERFTFSLVDGVGSSIAWGDIIETQVVGSILRPAVTS